MCGGDGSTYPSDCLLPTPLTVGMAAQVWPWRLAVAEHRSCPTTQKCTMHNAHKKFKLAFFVPGSGGSGGSCNDRGKKGPVPVQKTAKLSKTFCPIACRNPFQNYARDFIFLRFFIWCVILFCTPRLSYTSAWRTELCFFCGDLRPQESSALLSGLKIWCAILC